MAIEKFARLMQPAVIAEIASVKRASHDRVVERFSDLQFVTRAINVGTSSQLEIVLQILDEDLLFELLSGEANRFFLAAILSHARSKQTEQNNFAWQAVENYYSAYYAVHYLLRVSGRSLSSLDTLAARSILSSYFGSASPPIVPEGLYELFYEKSTKTLTLKKIPKAGGSHKNAWAMWVTLINDMQAVANTDPAEYASESVSLSAHRKFVVLSTGKYRPSEMRGEINYQFRGQCWRFEKKSDKSIKLLQGELKVINEFVMPVASTDASALLKNNYFIYSLAVAIFQAMAENYPRSIARALRNKYSDILT